MKELLALVHLEPPVNGLTTVSKTVLEEFRKMGLNLYAIRLTPIRNRHSLFFRRLSRFAFIWRTYVRTLAFAVQKTGDNSAIYFTLSGGNGQVLELPHFLIAWLFRIPMLVHHHSFSYVNRKSLLANFLFTIIDKRATHICLSPQMCEKLESIYKVNRLYPVSNALFLRNSQFGSISSQAFARSSTTLSIGFLGNIDLSKGILAFLDTAKKLEVSGIRFNARVAGPFLDDLTKEIVHKAAHSTNVIFEGPKYGIQKIEFLKSLDFILFPTTYVNEAEPLVILEALFCGVVVISNQRGCISEILEGSLSECCVSIENFSEQAVKLVSACHTDPQMLKELRRVSRSRAHELADKSEAFFSEAISSILDDAC